MHIARAACSGVTESEVTTKRKRSFDAAFKLKVVDYATNQSNRAAARTVCIRTTGHDKVRFKVFLAATADGRKLKPFVIFKGVRPVAELTATRGVIVAFSRNG